MSDQVRNLCPSIPGACLNSSQAPKQKREIYNKLTEGKLKILFISPEKLVMEDMRKFGKVGLICIDEIHCASEWSHNFRPSYLKLKEVVSNRFESSLLLGLTATLTTQAQSDLDRMFEFDNILRCSQLARKNLKLTITRDRDNDKLEGLAKLLRMP